MPVLMAVVNSWHPIMSGLEVRGDLRQPFIVRPVLVS
jgi:hypothetical protein